MIYINSWSVEHGSGKTDVSFSKVVVVVGSLKKEENYSITIEGEFTELNDAFYNEVFKVLRQAGLASKKEEISSTYPS